MGQDDSIPLSVVIPSYRGSRRFLELVDRIVNDDYSEKEVIVVVDEPLPEVLQELKKYDGAVKVIARNGRHGKVSALNQAYRMARGDIILFLDDDVVPSRDGFLGGIVEAMRGYDIGDIRKVITGRSFLARMVYYDYVGFNYGNYLFAKRIGRCIAFNGAAVAFKREGLDRVGGFIKAVSEDLETGLRSYVAGLRFTYIKDPAVLNDPPTSWREWFRQRVRWSIGAALWVKNNWRLFLKIIKENPSLAVLVVLLLFPSLASMIAALLAHAELFDKLLWLLFLSLSSYHPAFALITLAMSYRFLYTLLKALVVSLISFIVFSAYFYKAAKATGMRFNILEFAAYFFLYSPLWLTMLLAGFIRVLVFKKTDVKGWVVKE